MDFNEQGFPIAEFGETIPGRVSLNIYAIDGELKVIGHLTYTGTAVESNDVEQDVKTARYITQETGYYISDVSVDSGIDNDTVDRWCDAWIDEKTGALVLDNWEQVEQDELLKVYHGVIRAAAHVAIASSERY